MYLSTEDLETEPHTLTEIAVYLGLIKKSQASLPKKQKIKTRSHIEHVQDQTKYFREDDNLTVLENKEEGINRGEQELHTESVESKKYALDETEEKLIKQEIKNSTSVKEKIRLKIDYDSQEILDLCTQKIKEINNRLRYLDELKIDENYESELITEISDQRDALIAQYKKINKLIPILKEEIKNELIDYAKDLSITPKKSENMEKKFEPLPETKTTDMDWYVKSILQLTRALNQRYPSGDNSIQIPNDEHWFVETILRLIKLDEHAQIRTSTLEPTKTFSLETPKQDMKLAKNLEDEINDRIARARAPSVRISTEKINERLENIESKLNTIDVRKSQLTNDLTNLTTSIDTLRHTTTAKEFKKYPRKGVITLGILAIILGVLILFPINPPFLLQYIFGVGFTLIGGGIIIDSIWAHLERRGHK